jgi:hypothetical protein
VWPSLEFRPTRLSWLLLPLNGLTLRGHFPGWLHRPTAMGCQDASGTPTGAGPQALTALRGHYVKPARARLLPKNRHDPSRSALATAPRSPHPRRSTGGLHRPAWGPVAPDRGRQRRVKPGSRMPGGPAPGLRRWRRTWHRDWRPPRPVRRLVQVSDRRRPAGEAGRCRRPAPGPDCGWSRRCSSAGCVPPRPGPPQSPGPSRRRRRGSGPGRAGTGAARSGSRLGPRARRRSG